MRYAILLCLVGAGISLAGCGSSGSDPSGSTSAQNASSPSNNASNNAKGLQFAACMRSHGVPNFPDPTNGEIDLRVQQSPNGTTVVNGVQVNGPAFQSAMTSCRSKLPNGGTPTAAQSAKARSQGLAMARCMRTHGVPNFPDPTFQTGPNGGVGVRIGGPGLNPASPAFQAAAKVCGKIFGGLAPTLAKPAG